MTWMKSAMALGLILCAMGANATAAESADPYANETKDQRDARMKWWREARFGMFIHWGVYSVPAGTYKDKKIDGIGEWIMNRGKIPVAEYKAFAKRFNPVKYNPDEWVRLAKDAGMKYMIITSKHHDGFALFDSKVTGWDVVDATPYGKDLLKPLAEACRKHGMKLGFYYSQAQDWTHPGGAAWGDHWDKAQDGDMTEYIRKVAVPQVREILANYGDLAVLWWDTPCDMTKERADMLIPLLTLQPGIIHNNRLGGDYKGDTETPEQFIPATGYPGRDFEVCMTMNDTWGFKSYDDNWKSTETLIRNLVDIASKGGNYLLNVGPTSEGLIPAPSVERLKEIAPWMKVHGEAIYATTASPFRRLPWGRCTKKTTADGATLYLHVFDWPADGKLVVPGLKNKVAGAWMLEDADKKPLKTENRGDDVVIGVPSAAPSAICSVVVCEAKGAPEVVAVPVMQAADGSLQLSASDADIHGEHIRYEGGKKKDNIGSWTNPSDWVAWQVKLDRPGKFTATLTLATAGESKLEIAAGASKLAVSVPNTGGFEKFVEVSAGPLELTDVGKISITIKAVKEGWRPVNVRAIRLVPAL